MDKYALYAAAIAGDVDARAKLEMEADKLAAYDRTILHTESSEGNTEHVRFILREFSSKNLLVKLGNQQETALTWAAYCGHTQVAAILIDAARHLPPSNDDGNPVTSFQAFIRHADQDSETALHAAAKMGYVDIAKLLVEADPGDRHIQNKYSETPIYIAVRNGYTDIVKVICTTCTASLDLDGPGRSTALHAAIKNHNHDIELVEVLIAAARLLFSSSPDDDDADSITSFQAFLRKGDEEDNTALHAAVMYGHVAIVKILVEADPSNRHTQNREGKTPVYIAAEKGYIDIVKAICTTCTAPLNMIGPVGGSTVLHAAIKNRNHDIEVVEVLIAAAARLSSSSSAADDDNKTNTNDNAVTSFLAFLRKGDKDGNTALHIAVMQGNLATAKLLSEADLSDPGIQNNQGRTPFYTAVEGGHVDIVKMICTTSTVPIDLNGPSGRRTALHAVIKNLDEAKNEVRDVIKMVLHAVKCFIISNNKDVDEYTVYRILVDEFFSVTDEYRQTMLELAVERNYVEVVELILDVHNPAFRDDWIGDDFIGLMPLIYRAKDKENKTLVKLLSERYQAGAESSTHLKNQASLISAIRKRKEESVSRLLDKYSGDLVRFADNLGWTALHHAVYNEFNSVIERIVEEQNIFEHPFMYENMVSTPLHLAAEKGYTSIMILLMQIWPSWSLTRTDVDKIGQNTLHLAALLKKKEMIYVILKFCPEEYKNKFVNQQDHNGNYVTFDSNLLLNLC